MVVCSTAIQRRKPKPTGRLELPTPSLRVLSESRRRLRRFRKLPANQAVLRLVADQALRLFSALALPKCCPLPTAASTPSSRMSASRKERSCSRSRIQSEHLCVIATRLVIPLTGDPRACAAITDRPCAVRRRSSTVQARRSNRRAQRAGGTVGEADPPPPAGAERRARGSGECPAAGSGEQQRRRPSPSYRSGHPEGTEPDIPADDVHCQPGIASHLLSQPDSPPDTSASMQPPDTQRGLPPGRQR